MTQSPPLLHLDTHVVAWLYDSATQRLTDAAREAIEVGTLAVSPLVILELTYLQEIGRLTVSGPTIGDYLRELIDLRIDNTPFGTVAAIAHAHTWTRDPFDRLISAQSVAAGAHLVTGDRLIREHLPTAIW